MKKCSTCGNLYAGDLCPKCVAGFAQNPTAATQPPEELPLKPGQTFHGLEIVELLGRGGMGVVYKARQPALDRFVALKILPRRMALDPDFQSRFIREAKALGSLSHANIVLVHDFGAEGELFFFVMEFVDGLNLRNLLRDKKLDPATAMKIVPQLCDALEYAHAEGIVHRDIKPENILIDRKGRVKIADFGLAKLVGTDSAAHMLTMTNMVMGTPHYMAPEQVENPKSVDHRADIYSMGVVIYEMLTGELPIGRFEVPSKKVQVDVRLDEVVLKALEKAPDRRYQKAGEVKEAVTRATSVDAYSPTIVTPVPARKPPGRSTAILGAVAAAAVVVALIAVVTRPDPGRTVAPPVVPTPPVPEVVDLEKLHFGPDETPGNRRWFGAKPPWRNPFPAKTEADLEQVIQHLDRNIGLQNVARNELKQAYSAQWFGTSVLAMETPSAERLEREFQAISGIRSRWSYRKGHLLVLAFAGGREGRALLVDLVGHLQKKLGLPDEPPPMPVENLAIQESDLPKGWTIGDPGAVVIPGQASRTLIQAPNHEGAMTVVVVKWPSAKEAQAYEAKLRALDPGVPEVEAMKKSIRHEVLRSANVVAILHHRTLHLGGVEKISENLRQWMGHPRRSFDSIVPVAAELPEGYSFDKVLTDPKEAIEAVGLSGVKPSDCRKAFHATLKPHGSIQVFELTESKVRYAVENQLDKVGPSESTDDFVFGVQAPDDLSLDAIENRMREKFGYDRNRPRYIKMADARLVEKDLPQGWSIKPEVATEYTYLAELAGPGGPLKYHVKSFNDYGKLETFVAEEIPSTPGDVILVKDFIVVHLAGPEASWRALETFEAALRKKMRMDPPALEEVLYGPGLPNGKTFDETAEVRAFAAKAKLEAPLIRKAWKVDSDTIDAFLLHAKDEKSAETLAKPIEGAFRKGEFVAVVRGLEGAVPADVKKLSDQFRGRLHVGAR
jgi:serine/threonine protein kinase